MPPTGLEHYIRPCNIVQLEMNFSFLIFTLLVVKSKCQNKNSTTGGLKWVTFNQWHEMPGGVAENPIVRLSTYGDDICSINHDGCWQGGSIFVHGEQFLWNVIWAGWQF